MAQILTARQQEKHRRGRRQRLIVRVLICGSIVLVTGISFWLMMWSGSHLPSASAPEEVSLMMGGPFCDQHHHDIEQALGRLPGVTSIDLRRIPGHVQVQLDSTVIRVDEVLRTVNALKGPGWSCHFVVMK